MAVIADGHGILKTERLPILLDIYSSPMQGSGKAAYYVKTIPALQDLTMQYTPLKGMSV